MEWNSESLIYEAETEGLRVRVQPQFSEDESNPENEEYIWEYMIEILNNSDTKVKLLARHWQIIDDTGFHQSISGAGVIGKQPVIEPGDSFRYKSSVPLNTATGMMSGHYNFERADGENCEVEIPTFSLDSPYNLGKPN